MGIQNPWRALILILAVAVNSVGVAAQDGQVVAWGDTLLGSGLPQMQPILKITQVACGESHTLALLQDGSVIGWGSNLYGQRSIPAGLGPMRQVACGARHSIALTLDGAVTAWGGEGYDWNDHPPLGTTVQVVGLEQNTMALSSEGVVHCWGVRPQVNDVPADMGPVRKVAGSWAHAVALRPDGSVSCWGDNTNGQSNVPIDLPPCRDIAATQSMTYVVLETGQLVGWGDDPWVPTWYPDEPQAVAIAAGRRAAIVMRSSGETECFGNWNNQAALPAGLRAVSIAAGDQFGAAIAQDGTLIMAGFNYEGQCDPPPRLGLVKAVAMGFENAAAIRSDGTIVQWGRPISLVEYGGVPLPPDINDFVSIAAGFRHMAAVRSSGEVVCFGLNSHWQSAVPLGLPPIQQVACGEYHTLARTRDGQLFSWGCGAVGFLSIPPSVGTAVDIDSGGDYSVALCSDGTLVSWKAPTGDPGGLDPYRFDGYTPITDVAMGRNHALAVFLDGQVTASPGYPTPPDSGPFVAVAAGCSSNHSVALRSDGTVVSWGYGGACDFGQCDVPAGLTGVTAISANRFGCLAVVGPDRASCEGGPDACVATLAASAGSWSDLRSWSLAGCGLQVPGAMTAVDLGAFGSVGVDCSAQASTLVSQSGSSVLVTAAASAPGNDFSIRVGDTANLAGRVWLLGVNGAGSTLPEDLNIPILSASAIVGTFDLIQSELPPPPGFFVTLVPEDVNGRTLLSLRLLPLFGGGSLSGSTGTTFSGRTVAAETIDINHDGFDDLALAVDFGAGQNGLVQILLNDGLGGLGGTSVLASSPPQPTCLAVGDVDGDGDRDVVVGVASDSTVRVLLDNGTSGLVTGPVIGDLGGTPLAVAVRDTAGGTRLTVASQIMVGTSSNNLQVFSGSGGLLQTIALAGTPSVVKGGTIDGTRGKGIATGGTTSNSVNGLTANPTGFVQTILPRVDGLFEVVQTMYVTAKPVAMDVADLDGDGLDDIVTANAEPSLGGVGGGLPVLSIFRNSGGSFGGGVPYQPAGASSGLSVSLVDVDNDGDRDIVAVYRRLGADSEAALLRVDTLGAGTPISIGQTTVLDVSDPILSARGNLDGGGGEDVFLVNQPSGTSLTGLPEAKPFLATGQSKQGDLDGDGTVGASDISILLLDYGVCPGCPSDLDGSGEVDAGDIAFLLLLFD